MAAISEKEDQKTLKIDSRMSDAYARRVDMRKVEYEAYLVGDDVTGADEIVAVLDGNAFQKGVNRYIPQRKPVDDAADLGVVSLDAALKTLPDIKDLKIDIRRLRSVIAALHAQVATFKAERDMYHKAATGHLREHGMNDFRRNFDLLTGAFDKWFRTIAGPPALDWADFMDEYTEHVDRIERITHQQIQERQELREEEALKPNG